MTDFIVNAKPTQSTREVLPAGSYLATLYGIVDLGTQYSPMFANYQRKIRLSFELPSELRVFDEKKGEQPLAIHKEYTLSFWEKSNLRKDLKSWRGSDLTSEEVEQGFNLGKLIGKSCLLSIGTKESKEGNTYNVINGVSNLVKGMEAPKMINKELIYRITEKTDWEYSNLPEFLQKKIWESKEFWPEEEILFPEMKDEKKQSEEEDLPF